MNWSCRACRFLATTHDYTPGCRRYRPSASAQADHLTNPRTQVGPPASLPKARLAAK